VAPAALRAILSGDTASMSEDVRLVFQFAHEVLARDAGAEPLRRQIVDRWGEKGLISLAFAITMGRFFPTLKYALGHGLACSRVEVGGASVSPKHQPQVV
jgi:hypothetical protein